MSMSQNDTLHIAQEFLGRIGSGAEPAEIAKLFSEDVVFVMPGDDGVLPWIGRKTGRNEVADFIIGIRSMTEPIEFRVHEVLSSDARAVIIGELATRIKATGKVIESAIAIILTVSDGEVTRFQMLEDSFAVSRAARAS